MKTQRTKARLITAGVSVVAIGMFRMVTNRQGENPVIAKRIWLVLALMVALSPLVLLTPQTSVVGARTRWADVGTQPTPPKPTRDKPTRWRWAPGTHAWATCTSATTQPSSTSSTGRTRGIGELTGQTSKEVIVSETKTYTLTATNPTGTITRQVSVAVNRDTSPH